MLLSHDHYDHADLASVKRLADRGARLDEALRIGLDVRARQIVAMHFGTFDLADEPLAAPPLRFRAEADRLGLQPDHARVMKIGETVEW